MEETSPFWLPTTASGPPTNENHPAHSSRGMAVLILFQKRLVYQQPAGGEVKVPRYE